MVERAQECFKAIHVHMQQLCPPDDPLVGAFTGNQSTSFSNKSYAVGVTSYWLVLQPLSRKQAPKGAPIWLSPNDIANITLWGHGGGFREWMATNSEFQLRFTTTSGDKYKIMALGGRSMAKMLGQDYIDGLEAVATWLERCQH
jgi:hypothetical protein